MDNNYYLNYFKSVEQGLKNSIYFVNQQTSTPESFFQKIKQLKILIYLNDVLWV